MRTIYVLASVVVLAGLVVVAWPAHEVTRRQLGIEAGALMGLSAEAVMIADLRALDRITDRYGLAESAHLRRRLGRSRENLGSAASGPALEFERAKLAHLLADAVGLTQAIAIPDSRDVVLRARREFVLINDEAAMLRATHE